MATHTEPQGPQLRCCCGKEFCLLTVPRLLPAVPHLLQLMQQQDPDCRLHSTEQHTWHIANCCRLPAGSHLLQLNLQCIPTPRASLRTAAHRAQYRMLQVASVSASWVAPAAAHPAASPGLHAGHQGAAHTLESCLFSARISASWVLPPAARPAASPRLHAGHQRAAQTLESFFSARKSASWFTPPGGRPAANPGQRAGHREAAQLPIARPCKAPFL